MEDIVAILLYPVHALLQATVGVLWPSDDPAVRRMQKRCLATMVLGLILLLSGAVLAWLWPNWRWLGLFEAAWVVLVVSGAIGRRIERFCRTES